MLLLVSDLNWSKELIFPLIGLGQSRWAWWPGSATDLLLSIRSLYLIKRIFAPFAGLLFGLWSCYPAKLLFGLLQLSSEALDESIILCSLHIEPGS